MSESQEPGFEADCLHVLLFDLNMKVSDGSPEAAPPVNAQHSPQLNGGKVHNSPQLNGEGRQELT